MVQMVGNAFKRVALVVAFSASGAMLSAADGIGSFTGTSTPQVITPQMTPAPQTPAYPSPVIGPVYVGPMAPRFHHHWRGSARPNR
jgi:hypothetical protein